ncbi:TldD/PmbA family protein [Thermococcus sp. M39]|uniref:TldD/PmbA family protein n=1 Tax=unclassified Thermococcus TaxID=2627626 RepID=UPI00143B6844|nr:MULTISPECIES: TldD/PmbA family protein [unclassified Thermococcus]NJE09045.1 TldD/PmbA family protein [Thermococcus sp. M39]NJE13290.1 TldD/PmbA family protein [Thermococcus sp. LS2]
MIDELIKILNHKDVEWEIYWEIGRGSSFKIERCELVRAQRKYHSGIGLRVGYKGKIGFSYITGINHDRATLERFVNRTIKLAKVSEVPFHGFSDDNGKNKVKALYDKRIEELSFDDAYATALSLTEKEKELKEKFGKEYTFSGGLAFGVSTDGIANSNGIEKSEKTTGLSISIHIVKRAEKNGIGSYYKGFRLMPDFEREFSVGLEKALEEVELSYNAKKIDGYEGELILEPHAVASLMSILMVNLYGDNVYHRRSRFSKVEDRIASESFTLIDDATLEGKLGSYSFDGEGNPSQRTVLIENGILKGFLFDETYAKLMNTESTGNAVRDFRTTPHIGNSNVIVDGKRENLEELEKAIIIKRVFGEHTANPVSGDFSLTVELGYIIENGEVKPFKDNMFAGNIFELINSIISVGKEKEEIGSFISPRILSFGRIV